MNEVTQADRDEVYRWQTASSHAPNKLAAAFARHRIASTATLQAENVRLKARVAELEGAGRNIKPYLIFTIGKNSPGYHPTMPSAVNEFCAALKDTDHAA